MTTQETLPPSIGVHTLSEFKLAISTANQVKERIELDLKLVTNPNLIGQTTEVYNADGTVSNKQVTQDDFFRAIEDLQDFLNGSAFLNLPGGYSPQEANDINASLVNCLKGYNNVSIPVTTSFDPNSMTRPDGGDMVPGGSENSFPENSQGSIRLYTDAAHKNPATALDLVEGFGKESELFFKTQTPNKTVTEQVPDPQWPGKTITVQANYDFRLDRQPWTAGNDFWDKHTAIAPDGTHLHGASANTDDQLDAYGDEWLDDTHAKWHFGATSKYITQYLSPFQHEDASGNITTPNSTDTFDDFLFNENQ